MTSCFVRGVSVFGPGMPCWQEAGAVLRGEVKLPDAMPAPPAPAFLSPNERRRAGRATRIALAVGSEAAAMAGLAPHALACVFASSNGEGSIVHGLLETLAGPDRLVSPTQFHNSVHNAVAGYWSIGTGSTQPVTCLACHDWTFASALLQAVAECAATRRDILLCVYDVPIPAPLGDQRLTGFDFATALVLSPGPAPGALARLDATPVCDQEAPDDPPQDAALRRLCAGNSAARSLRLLESLARRGADRFALALPDGHAIIGLTPC